MINDKTAYGFFYIFLAGLWLLPAYAQIVQHPDDFHGPRTKWIIYPDLPSGPDCTGPCINRHSIIPQMDIPMDDWMKTLEETGANSATINLEARRGLINEPIHPTFDIAAADINMGGFTPEQRNLQLLDFLIRVQGSINRGAINGNIRFHIHQRLYPRQIPEREQQFIKDFSDFINLAKEYGVDHLIAGIRLGEHGNDGRNYMLDFAIRTARGINNNTGGWLREKGGYEMSGDDYGRMFKDIQNQPLSSTFFQEISMETAWFAFCYKAFGVSGAISGLGYNTQTLQGWTEGLLEGMGLADLISFLHDHRDQYPLHANVIFIGDSGDAMRQIGNLEYTAITSIFSGAGKGFRGVIGINGYRRPDKGTADDYLYLFDALHGMPAILKPNTLRRWQSWPAHDAETSNFPVVQAMSGKGGIISPSGPILAPYGSSHEFTVTPFPGYAIKQVLLNEQDYLHDNGSFSIESITEDIDVQVVYKKEDESQNSIISIAYENGTIAPEGNLVAENGTTQHFVIIPEEGYVIKKVMIDGLEADVGNIFMLEDIDRDYTVQVHFELSTSMVDNFEDEKCMISYDRNTKTLQFLNKSYNYTMELYGMNGSLLYREVSQSDRTVLPDFSTGMYILRYTMDKGEVCTVKILI